MILSLICICIRLGQMVHTPIQEMGEALIERGYTHGVITDHSQYLKVANGLTPERLLRQRTRNLCIQR